MDGGHQVRSKRGFNELSPLFSYTKLRTEQCLGCGGAEGHNHLWLDERYFGLEPGTARRDFLSVGFFVDAAFATWFSLKMFDHIGDVSLRAIDAGFSERIIEQATCGSNKGFALEILFIAWLLADKHHDSAAASFAEDGLRTQFPEVASFAIGGGLAQRRQA